MCKDALKADFKSSSLFYYQVFKDFKNVSLTFQNVLWNEIFFYKIFNLKMHIKKKRKMHMKMINIWSLLFQLQFLETLCF